MKAEEVDFVSLRLRPLPPVQAVPLKNGEKFTTNCPWRSESISQMNPGIPVFNVHYMEPISHHSDKFNCSIINHQFFLQADHGRDSFFREIPDTLMVRSAVARVLEKRMYE